MTFLMIGWDSFSWFWLKQGNYGKLFLQKSRELWQFFRSLCSIGAKVKKRRKKSIAFIVPEQKMRFIQLARVIWMYEIRFVSIVNDPINSITCWKCYFWIDDTSYTTLIHILFQKELQLKKKNNNNKLAAKHKIIQLTFDSLFRINRHTHTRSGYIPIVSVCVSHAFVFIYFNKNYYGNTYLVVTQIDIVTVEVLYNGWSGGTLRSQKMSIA